jgi:hypothetical protein
VMTSSIITGYDTGAVGSLYLHYTKVGLSV